MLKYIVFTFLFLSNFCLAESLSNNELNKIEKYLNNIHTAEAEFIQLNHDGTLSEGIFYLKRPGKFRWQYNDQPIIVISNGKSLIYYDTELEQSNYIPIENSIAALITRKKIKFNSDLEVIKSIKTEGAMLITAKKSKQKDIGEFTFVFSIEPFELKKIELTDANKQKVSVNFINFLVNPSKKISDDLFTVKDSRFK